MKAILSLGLVECLAWRKCSTGNILNGYMYSYPHQAFDETPKIESHHSIQTFQLLLLMIVLPVFPVDGRMN